MPRLNPLNPTPMWPTRRLALTQLIGLSAFLNSSTALGQVADRAASQASNVPASRGGAELFTETLPARLQAAQVPGLSWALIANGQMVHAGAWGFADLATRQPMRTDSLLSTASVTKTFTGALLLQEVDRGRCALDEAADRHLPFALRHPAHPEARITLRHLLTHTSGLADGLTPYEASYACGDPLQPLGEWLQDALHSEAAKAKPPFHADAPGSRHAYSNVGYGLIGLVLERLSGLSFDAVLRQGLLDPLNMARSFVLLRGQSDPETQSRLATAYELLGSAGHPPELLNRLARGAPLPSHQGSIQQQALCKFGFATISDGLLRSSTLELSRFAMALLHGGVLDGNRILRAPTIAQMFNDQLAALPVGVRPARYQQGLTWRGLGDGVWAHFGRDPGVAAALAVRQRDGRGLAMLANSSRARPLLGQFVSEWMATQV
jgi:CubicO group peptidase (beta-lactamase class C family)